MWGITVTHAATFIASISRKSKRLVRVLPFTPFLGHPQLRNAGLGPTHIQDLYIYIQDPISLNHKQRPSVSAKSDGGYGAWLENDTCKCWNLPVTHSKTTSATKTANKCH